MRLCGLGADAHADGDLGGSQAVADVLENAPRTAAALLTVAMFAMERGPSNTLRVCSRTSAQSGTSFRPRLLVGRA